MAQAYNVLIVMQFTDLKEGQEKEIFGRLEEHGLEKIPTLTAVSAWETKIEAEDETMAKDQAVQEVFNVCRTYPIELRLLVQCGTGQIMRRKKQFEV